MTTEQSRLLGWVLNRPQSRWDIYRERREEGLSWRDALRAAYRRR